MNYVKYVKALIKKEGGNTKVASKCKISEAAIRFVAAGERKLTLQKAQSIFAAFKTPAKIQKAILAQIKAEQTEGAEGRRVGTQEQSELVNEETNRGNRNLLRRIENNHRETRTYFVTTAVEGASVFKEGMQAVETFLKKESAQLIILPCLAHKKGLDGKHYPLDPEILARHSLSVFSAITFNKFLIAADLNVIPTSSDPIASFASYGAEQGISYIISHPTQRLKTLPNGLKSKPRLQASPGAITLPRYLTNKQGLIAESHHVVGGMVVEVNASGFRAFHVQFAADGSFVHLGMRYSAKGTVQKTDAVAIVRGDDHNGPNGFGDVEANLSCQKWTKVLNPQRIYINDLFDASSISHHKAHNIIARASLPAHAANLAVELNTTKEFLVSMSKSKPKNAELIVLPANHNEHLHRYLSEGRFIDDPTNVKIAAKLFSAWINDGKDPLIEAVDPTQTLASWPSRYDQIVEEGVTIHHGDIGLNGAKGSVKSDHTAYGKSSAGHSHSVENLHGATKVGTMSRLQQDYNRGPSSWCHCFEVIYEGGSRQLMIIIDGVASIKHKV